MLSEIASHIQQTISNFTENDSLILNESHYKIDKNNFQPIIAAKPEGKALIFIDGGQAEILSAGNFCLSFIRVAAITFKDNQKTKCLQNEFYLFTTAAYQNKELYYQAKIFTRQEQLIEEQDLLISSSHPSIKTGLERAPIGKISAMARRFAELALARIIAADNAVNSNVPLIILDGTLEKTLANEEKYLGQLGNNVSSIAKTSSLFTATGNSPAVLLSRLSPPGVWHYPITEQTSLVKLNPAARHIFRFEGNRQALPHLIANSSDALFLGYPYGLILADKLARVSEQEKQSLSMQFLLKRENKALSEYLQNTNAHQILDRIS